MKVYVLVDSNLDYRIFSTREKAIQALNELYATALKQYDDGITHTTAKVEWQDDDWVVIDWYYNGKVFNVDHMYVEECEVL